MIGRISTFQFNQNGMASILDAQQRVSRLQEQIGTGKRVLTPSDDPAAAASAATVGSYISAETPRIATYSLAHFFKRDSSHMQLSKYLMGKSCVYRVHAESPCNCILNTFDSW